MKTLVLAAAKSQSGNWPLEQLSNFGNVNMSDSKRWFVDTGEDWIAVSTTDTVRGEYEPEDLEKIIEKIGDPVFYLLESHTAGLMTRYIQNIPNKPGVLIDNDHGWVASIGDYKEAIAKNADWLYAQASPLSESQSMTV